MGPPLTNSNRNRIEKSGKKQKPGPRILISVGIIAVALCIASCIQVSYTAFQPPAIPGAEFVGTEECTLCHDQLGLIFNDSPHANLMIGGDHDISAGCESCHGPGSLHSDEGEGRFNIINPGRSPETCLQCHVSVRSTFQLPGSHPVMDGHLACIDCHDPHQGTTPAETEVTASFNKTRGECTSCHIEQRGPFAFEHEAMREGCTTCHAAHGSINDKMLTVRNANLCLQCHFQEQTVEGRVYIGSMDHTFLLQTGTCWSSGCHSAIHGSQIDTHLQF